MDEEQNTGGFFTEDGEIIPVEGDITAEIDEAHRTIPLVIDEALTKNEITPAYAELLKSIRTESTSGDIGTLKKVHAALALHLHTAPQLSKGRVAHLASGYDWEFVAALGGRTIDMVDPVFAEEKKVAEFFRSIKDKNPDATMTDAVISFTKTIDTREETMQLHLVPTTLEEYNPTEKLSGIVEFAGPTKNYDRTLILPHLEPALQPGAPILNFDFSELNPNAPTPTDFSKISQEEFTYFTKS